MCSKSHSDHLKTVGEVYDTTFHHLTPQPTDSLLTPVPPLEIH